MVQIQEYGKLWEVDEALGQPGLIRENHYKPLFTDEQRPLSLRKGDVWLDVGANIGAFAIRAAEFVDTVVAVEPEPKNITCLERNIAINGVNNVIIIREAVIADSDERMNVPLAISNSFSSTHRVGPIRGRDVLMVPAIGINDLVSRYYVNKIKMDCEGSEAEILEDMNFGPITEIIFEYHFSFLKDHDWSRFRAILAKIDRAGLQILKEPKRQSKSWHTIVWAKRP